MSANIFGNRFYGNRIPAWHNLGFVSDTDRNAQESLSILGSYWIEKRPVIIMMNNEKTETGDFALVRSAVPDDSKEKVFGYCSNQYNILQPDEICQLFDNWVKQPVETLGMLGKGEKIFLTWVLPTIDVKGDEVKTYGFVACGYDGKFGSSLSLVTTRVVCQNTFMAAINESESTSAKENGRGRIYSGHHNSTNMARDLGIWMEHIQEKSINKVNEMQEKFVSFASKPVEDTETLANLLFKIYPDPKSLPSDYPDKLRQEKQEKIDELAEKARRDRLAVETLFSGQGTAIDATSWGLFNSVTEYANWGGVIKKPIEYSVIMGNRAKIMANAFSVIDDFVNG